MYRSLSVTNQVNDFLTLVDAAGSVRGQRASHFVSQLAKDTYDAAFYYVPSGKLTIIAYEGIDPHFEGYSRYRFEHGLVQGLYASSPDHVILLELRIRGAIPAALDGVPERREDVA